MGPSAPSSPLVLAARLARRYLGVAALLAALFPLTLAVEAWVVRRAEGGGPDEAAAARARVEALTAALLGEMAATADRLAADASVRRALADTTARPSADPAALDAVGRPLPEWTSVEVYDPALRLVAWNGAAAPLALRRPLDTLRTDVVQDGAGRRSIELWRLVWRGNRSEEVGGREAGQQNPIRYPLSPISPEPIGVVRVLRVVQAAVPVRNRFLRDYAVADDWREEIGLPFAVAFTGGRRAADPDATPLVGPDGSRLGWVSVPPPPPTLAAERVRSVARGVVGLWAALLLVWGLAGLGHVHSRATRRAERARSSTAWARAGGLLAAWSTAWWAARYALVALDLPGRWAGTGRALPPLFDPAYLASDLGGGLLGSPGDLTLTALWGGVFAAVVLRFALRRAARPVRPPGAVPSVVRAAVAWPLALAAGGAVLAASAVVARRAVLDATLPYFDRSGPLPDALTLAVLAALIALAGAAVALAAAAFVLAREEAGGPRLPPRWPVRLLAPAVYALGALGLGAAVALERVELGAVPPAVPVGFLALAALAAAVFLREAPEGWAWPLSFRGLLFSVFLLAGPVYVAMLGAAAERRDATMAEAARAFAGGQDRRAVFAIEQVLAEARADDALRPALLVALEALEAAREGTTGPDSARLAAFGLLPDSTGALPDSARNALDALAGTLLTGSFLAALPDYAVGLAVLSPRGDTLAVARGSSGGAARPAGPDPLAFASLRARYEADSLVLPFEGSFLVAREPVARRRGVFRYAGLGSIAAEGAEPAAWVHVEALPQPPRATETPFPLVFVPAGLLGEGEGLAFAEYDGGVRVRSRGDPPGPAVLDPAVRAAFARDSVRVVWHDERIEGERVRALYQRQASAAGTSPPAVVAVRAPAVPPSDHLFYLLRLTLAGLLAGAVVYALGVPARRRAGLLPAARTHFRDKVLNRFLLIGLASVGLTGLIGQRVVVEQNRQAVRVALGQRLERAEAAVLAAVADETEASDPAPPEADLADALARVRPEAIGAALGVDLHVYRGPDLVATSRPSLVRQRLIDRRLPLPAWRALVADGAAVAFVEERIGGFAYTTGYRAVRDSTGRAVGAVAVPTLPEQAAIEAGQARMVAYLFGALLGLLLVIFTLTALLANQLTRPFRRLRAGLEAVGAGRLDRPIPVETRDEVGELVESFNLMQAQLAESRRRLAQQERELAWREMARQVAHEIKNPLMPMKLSVQHLRRLFRPPGEEARPETVRFAAQFEKTTGTLIEQMDALDRIAGAFSNYARLPQRTPEAVDLNAVVREAAALFEGEAGQAAVGPGRARLALALAPEALVVLADREELRRAYINLIKNALQALPAGREGRISVQARREAPGPGGPHGWATTEVDDDGPGIPAEIRDRVFQPNFSTKSRGMGLGLAIVQRDVEAMGGTVTFETEDGEGTTFRLCLPLAPPEPGGDGQM